MKRTKLENQIESLLFFVGDVIPNQRLCELCETTEVAVYTAIYKLNEVYIENDSGLRIVEVENGYQMCTDPVNIELIMKYKQKPPKKLLTQALLETLAIIAYSQPITRAQIEDLRGVRSEHAISKLLDFNLTEEVGRLNVVGKPILYGTSQEFLRHFGFKNIEELPVVKEELIELFKKEVQEEINYLQELNS